MTIGELERWLDARLSMRELDGADDSLNGLQVGNRAAEVRRVAFAVDACAETIARAAERGADALFVHHGLLWGPARLVGATWDRVSALAKAGMALFGCHLPLDRHPELGNNAVLARLLGIVDPVPFGEYHGVPLGFRGVLETPLSIDEAVRRVLPDGGPACHVIPAGPTLSRSAAVVSGGAAREVAQAIEAGAELYVTGESSHSVYHLAMESRINMIAAGHYATETWGAKAVAEAAARELGLETFFIDLPTGL